MPQICSKCSASNRDTARFCQNCANPLQSGVAPAGPATGLLTPQTLLSKRYIILQKVGQGGMAAVYQAADTRISGKLWAVKEMSDAALTNPLDKQEAADAFRREAQVLSGLAHPNIPRITDFFSEGGRQYLVMEFIEGQTLEDILEKQNGPLSEQQVRFWADQLCGVLAYLHSRTPPIIFRDLKPGNMIVDQEGNIKLIDFGIVRFFQPGKRKDTVPFGTDGYAPPEQYGKGQTDARSDIYALGACLHQLLTNQDPALTPFRFKSVRIFNPNVSPVMETVIMRALEQDPAKRWQNANEMRQALSGVQTPSGPNPAKSGPSAPSAYTYPPTPARPAPQPTPRPAPSPAPIQPRPAIPFLPPGTEFAGFGRRFVAYFIDVFLLALPYTCLNLLLTSGMESADPDTADVLLLLYCGLYLLFLLTPLLYYTFLPARSGQTVGKKIMGIKIITQDGALPGVGRCFIRYIGYLVSILILYIGFLMPLWTERKEALHDMIAGTYVVRT